MAKRPVRAYTRTVHGKPQRVGRTTRKLQPRRAGRNAKRAYRSVERKRHSDAVVWGSLAAAEIGAWATMRGTALLLTGIGIALVGLGIAARRTAR